jgi:AhpD family alkylhydroperoxidase
VTSFPPKKTYSWISRLIFKGQELKYGQTLNPAYWWGKSPWLLFGLQMLYRCMDRDSSPITRPLKALVSLRVSHLNNCEFCFDLSQSQLKKLNISEEKTDNLHQHATHPVFSPLEKAALAYADFITIQGSKTAAKTRNNLKPFLSNEQIIELTAWIAFQNMSSKFNAALDIPPQGFCKLPKK